MNLLIYVPQMATYGGMERHVTLLARAAADAGHRVALWTTSNSLAAAERAALRAAGVELRELPLARGRAAAAIKITWLWYRLLHSRLRRDRWDTIYTNGQSALSVWVWHAQHEATRILHHHHTAADDAERLTWSPGFRNVLRRAPVLVGCSAFTARQLSSALERNDVSSLPYLTAELLPSAQVADSPLPGDRPLRFGYLGRMVSTKGVDTLLALSNVPELADIHWELHGAGPSVPTDLAAYPRVSLHPPYDGPAEQVVRLAGLDATVLLSRHQEGQPLSLTEAMAAGLPWLATDRGGTAELAHDSANCELLPPGADLATAAAAVRRLADRIRSGATSRSRQRAVYDRHYSPPAVAQRWLAFLNPDGQA